MNSDAGNEKLLDALWQLATEGGSDAGIPDGASLSVEEGEELQLRMLDRWLERGESVAGWKVGMTSGRARNAFGPGVRPFGYILGGRVSQGGERISARSSNMNLEHELCFRFASRIDGDKASVNEVFQATASVCSAFEIGQNRLGAVDDPGVRVADNLRQWGVVTGDEGAVPPVAFNWGSVRSTLCRDGEVIDEAVGEGNIDPSFDSIVLLAKELGKFGRAIEPGHIVITGSHTRARLGGVGRYEGIFSPFGRVAVDVDTAS